MADGIQMLTVYAFSTENWSREENEISTLMLIITKYSATFKQEALTKNVQVKIFSTGMTFCLLYYTLQKLTLSLDKKKLPSYVQDTMRDLESSTAHCNGFTLNICLSYGSRAEITQAVAQISADVVSGTIQQEDITEELVKTYLITKDIQGIVN